MVIASQEVLDLFENVLMEEVKNHVGVDVADALTAVRCAYKALSHDEEQDVSIDYKQASYRYAYIYYFAVCHTLVVTRQASRILLKQTSAFCSFMGYEKSRLDICSLGGGPGCDLIGLLRLRGAIGLGQTKQINCTVVDVSSCWQHSLKYLLNAYLKSSEGSIYRGKLNFALVRANLLSSPPRLSALKKIQDADILTLVKFVSALPSENASDVLQFLFCLLKPGAYVFFSDNGNGDAYEAVAAAAEGAGLVTVSPQRTCVETISNKRLPSLGPLKITLRPLKYTYACSAVWKR